MINLKFEEAKIFKDTTNSLTFVKYNPDDDYFDFIAEQCSNKKLNHFIVTSNKMIELIISLVMDYKFELKKVEFMNDDENLYTEINDLVMKSTNDSSTFIFLLRKLQLLSDEQSIDILKIFLKKRCKEKSTQIKIQANGIFFIDKSSFQSYAQKLLDIISDS